MERVFWGEMCGVFFRENKVKLEVKKNLVIGGQIIYVYIFSMLLIQVHILICTKKKLVLQLVAG